MKSLRINHMLAVFAAILFFSSVAFAAPTISLIAGSPDASNQTEIKVNLSGLSADQINQLKASGTAFTLEFDEGVTLVAGSVESTFFDMFQAQFDKAGTDPNSYTVPVEGYHQPLVVNNEGASKAMIAAARCTPTDNSTENELMKFKVEATQEGCVTLTPTVLHNDSAGYTTPTPIDVLVGSSTDPNIEPTDLNAYPVLIDSLMPPVSVCLGSVVDIDKDGLPDSWESEHFGSITVTDGSSDFDHDGYSDAQEYTNNTDPTVQNESGGPGYNELTDYRVTNLDIDGNGTASLGSDGVLLLRYLYNLRNDKLIVNAVEPSCVRCDATAIQDYIAKVKDAIYDVDGSGTVDLGSDGVIILRYMYNLRNEKLIDSAIGNNATRQTATEIQDYISPLIP